jgi:hypothetical protein
VKGKIKLEDNKSFVKHLAFFVNNKFRFMPLYEDVRRINDVELDSNLSKEVVSDLVKDHLTPIMVQGTIDIMMINDEEFVSKTNVSDMPLNKEITISI